MKPRARVTAALVGLIALVVVGWLVTDARSPEPPPLPGVTSTVPATATIPPGSGTADPTR